jgi:hypothetical protein
MNPARGRVLPVLVATGVLIGGANLAAYAANGQPLVLGHSNSESGTTQLRNTDKGAALALKTAKKSPPLAVNSSKLVKHLNADKVDGRSSSSLGLTGQQFKLPGGGQAFTLKVKPGTYQVAGDIEMNAIATALCEITLSSSPAHHELIWYGASTGILAVASGTGILKVKTGQNVNLGCDNPVYQASDFTSYLTLSRMSKLTKGTPTKTARSLHGGSAQTQR